MICTDTLEYYNASVTAHEYVCAHTSYAYTTLRTVGGNRILLLNNHI